MNIIEGSCFVKHKMCDFLFVDNVLATDIKACKEM
jgi:hypothetical protein